MRIWSILLIFLLGSWLTAQEIIGRDLLEKAITFHDPNQNWNAFNGTFQVKMQTPNSADRISTISLDFPNSKFALEVSKEEDTYAYALKEDECVITLNGSADISKADQERLRLSCDRGKMYRNYYSYLYGLPMKLKDKGTIIHEKIERKTFKDKEYLVLKATYDKSVGGDTWYFYFDPKTYAMEVYQFFHDESKNDGEYILLSGMETVEGIRMPKTRKWYYNKDDKYLGADILN